MGLSDRMVWSLTKDGQYSVNSGHKLAKSSAVEKDLEPGYKERSPTFPFESMSQQNLCWS